MLRYLSVTAITAGLLFSANPSAVACDSTHCPGTSIVCAAWGGCPIHCEYVDAGAVDRRVCILN